MWCRMTFLALAGLFQAAHAAIFRLGCEVAPLLVADPPQEEKRAPSDVKSVLAGSSRCRWVDSSGGTGSPSGSLTSATAGGAEFNHLHRSRSRVGGGQGPGLTGSLVTRRKTQPRP